MNKTINATPQVIRLSVAEMLNAALQALNQHISQRPKVNAGRLFKSKKEYQLREIKALLKQTSSENQMDAENLLKDAIALGEAVYQGLVNKTEIKNILNFRGSLNATKLLKVHRNDSTPSSSGRTTPEPSSTASTPTNSALLSEVNDKKVDALTVRQALKVYKLAIDAQQGLNPDLWMQHLAHYQLLAATFTGYADETRQDRSLLDAIIDATWRLSAQSKPEGTSHSRFQY
jgi:hypothetical protein